MLSTNPKNCRFIIHAFTLILLLQLGHEHVGHSYATKLFEEMNDTKNGVASRIQSINKCGCIFPIMCHGLLS